jgi:hypothetical protein
MASEKERDEMFDKAFELEAKRLTEREKPSFALFFLSLFKRPFGTPQIATRPRHVFERLFSIALS